MRHIQYTQTTQIALGRFFLPFFVYPLFRGFFLAKNYLFNLLEVKVNGNRSKF